MFLNHAVFGEIIRPPLIHTASLDSQAISAFLEKQGASSKSDKKKLAKALNTVLLPRKKTTSGKASTAGSVSTGVLPLG